MVVEALDFSSITPGTVWTSSMSSIWINFLHTRKWTAVLITFTTCVLSWVYIWMRIRTTHVEARRGRMYRTFVHCSAFGKAVNRPYIHVLSENSLWSTNSLQIAFSCSPQVRRTAECCLPCLSDTSTLNNRFVFACRVRVHIQI